MALAAGTLRKRFGFSKVALGALMLTGLLSTAMALTPFYWLGLVLWALNMGLAECYLPTTPKTVNPESTDHAVAGA